MSEAQSHPSPGGSATRVRQRSPNAGGDSERKRRRKVLSCYDCRRRKLQCDRTMPACSRCTKAGNGANCLYIDEPSDAAAKAEPARTEAETRRNYYESTFPRPAQPAAPPGDLLARLEFQDRRIKQLEAALAMSGQGQDLQRIRGPKLPLTPESVNEPSTAVNDREGMCLRGKSFRTQFFGSTHPGALIACIPSLNLWTKEAIEKFPGLQRIRCDVHSMEDQMRSEDALLSPVKDEDLKLLLPSKAEADELVHLYIDSYDSIYHIIHLPSFWKEYDELWSDLTDASTHFVALVLLMMACVSCLSDVQPLSYVAGSSSARRKSMAWIRACEDWIDRQSQKHTSSGDFQIRCLLWLAKQMSARKFKRTWTEAGTLLRFCMSAGLHRNPNLLQKQTTALDKELRRRIWATAVDFELQASFDRGMVSAPWLLQSDCPGPNNIHDVDFDLEQAPAARPVQDFTSSSYLTLANESLMLRSTLNAVLNNIRQTLSFDDVKQYTDEIETHLRSIPDWASPKSDAPHALLSLKLHQYLLVLHDRHLRQANTMAERNFSKMIILETASKILETHKYLVGKGNLVLELFCSDYCRVPLSIAHLVSYVDPQADMVLSGAFEHAAPGLLEEAIELVNDKVVRFGQEHRQLWLAVASAGHLKALRDPDRRERYMQEAVDRILKPYYKTIASQEKPPVAHMAPGQTGTGGSDRSYGVAQTQPNSVDLEQAASAPALLDPPLFDLDELADWTFQDWFNPSEFQSFYPPPQNASSEAYPRS